MFGENPSSTADAKHRAEAISTDYFGKGRQVETLNYWAVSFSCTSPAFQAMEKECMSLAMSKNSDLRNTSQPVVTTVLASQKAALNWNDWGWRWEWVHCESYGYKRVWHAQPSVQHKGGKTGVSWIMSKVGQFRESFNLKKKKKRKRPKAIRYITL